MMTQQQKEQAAEEYRQYRARIDALPIDRKCYLCSGEIQPGEPGVEPCGRGGHVVHTKCARRASAE